jgi:hypothetical protein
MEAELMLLPLSVSKILNHEIIYECTLTITQKYNLIVVGI